MLKNPMVLMMLFMGGMAFVMPKMMEGLDQEQLEEMRGKVWDFSTASGWLMCKQVISSSNGKHDLKRAFMPRSATCRPFSGVLWSELNAVLRSLGEYAALLLFLNGPLTFPQMP
jgi:hypothetical protein